MTGPRRQHLEFEELISASLAGELTADERRRLDAHLDGCDACRGTLAAFADGRRIVAGLRHVPVPRDLHARVRTGIERGRFATLPWWRRPAVLFAGIGGGLAAVAGALLALVLLSDPSPQIGEATPTPSATVAASVTPTPDGTFPSGPTPSPGDATPPPSPSEPAATPTPPEPPAPEPDAYLALTGPADNRALTIRDGKQEGELIAEVDTPPGPPTAAQLSPDGQWIAYITPVGERGTHEIRVTRLPEGSTDAPEADDAIGPGETVVLGESLTGDPFLEALFWSAESRYLAFTVAHLETTARSVWLFDTTSADSWQFTDGPDAYAGSWVDREDGAALWVGVPGSTPVSHLNQLLNDTGDHLEVIDPAGRSLATEEGVFQPLLSPNGRFAIYWNGAMEDTGEGWQFVSGAQPYLAEHDWEDEPIGFSNERTVFSDLSVGRDGFTSASITWGEDSIAYAVWNARWTGPPQSGTGEAPYPDEARVYFGRATDSRRLTSDHAIDRDDIPEGWRVVDVKVSPTGEHLVITIADPVAGTLDEASARLLLVERNTGNEADAVEEIDAQEGHWYGPAAFDRRSERADGP